MLRASGRTGRRAHLTALGVVLLLALGLRLAGLSADLPDMHNTDEVTNLGLVDRMVTEGDPHPRFFNYPSLLLYLHAAAHLDGPVLGLLPGLPETAPQSLTMGTAHTATPGAVLAHRGVSVALGLLVVAGSALAAWRVTGSRAATLAAALLLACSPTAIAHSRHVTPDVLAAAAVTAALLAALRVLRAPTWRACVLAGAAVGLAGGAKYNAALVAVAVVAAVVLAAGREERDRVRASARAAARLLAAGAAAVAVFLATTPFALLDRAAFLRDLRFEMAHYATGHAGMEGGAAAFYARHLVTQETVLTVLLLVGLALLLARVARRAGSDEGAELPSGWQQALVVAAFPVAYLAQVSTYAVRNDRTLLLALPALAVLAGAVLASDRALAVRDLLRRRPLGRLAAVAGLATAVAALGGQALTVTPLIRETTARAQAQEWFARHVPAGTRVVLESYSPWLDPDRYAVDARGRAIDGDRPTSATTDLVVLSEQMYGRYVDDPGRHPREAAAYADLVAGLEPVADFDGAGPRIRVLSPR